jgi:hypothetical protein
LADAIKKMADTINDTARLKHHLAAPWQKKGAGKLAVNRARLPDQANRETRDEDDDGDAKFMAGVTKLITALCLMGIIGIATCRNAIPR